MTPAVGLPQSTQGADLIRQRGTSYAVAAGTVMLILCFFAFVVGFALMGLALLDGPPPRPRSEGPPPAFAFLFLGNVVAMLVGVALLATYLVDVFNNPDLADSSERRVMWTLLIVFLGAWAMSVYWWLYLRPGSDSFKARPATEPSPQSAMAGTARRIGLYVVTAPVVFIMGLALIRDPGRLGEPADVSGAPIAFFVVVGSIVTALMAAACWLSTFRYRIPVLLLQVVVVWLGGLLYAFEVRTHVNGWDIAEDGVLLVTALLQLVPGLRNRSGSNGDRNETESRVAV